MKVSMMVLKQCFMALFLLVCSFYNSIAQSSIPEVRVCKDKTTMIICPVPVIDVDMGNSAIATRIVKKMPTVLKLKATKDSFPPTNLTIYTEDCLMYMASIVYDPSPPTMQYQVSFWPKPISTRSIAKKEDEVPDLGTIKSICENVKFPLNTKVNTLDKNSRIKIVHRGTMQGNGLLIFRFIIRNKSAIPFNLDFTRFFIQDKSEGKRTSKMEKEIFPLHMKAPNLTSINPQHQSEFILAFPRFTISNKKILSCEFFEKNGDRHLRLSIKGRDLLHAFPIH